MASYDYDIGVIGGGAAGLTTASGCAQLGARTLLVEKEPVLGGDCLHFGCVPSKTLIHCAKVYHQAQSMIDLGLPTIDLPAVDFSHIASHIRRVIANIQRHDSVERFCDLGVQVEFGEPVFKDEQSIQLDGRALSAKIWVLATGSSPRIPDIKGLGTSQYLTNKELFFLDRLPGSLIVIGAGPVAVEMAQAFCRLGSQVHVIQRGTQILSREDRDLADLVRQCLENEGVTFHLQTQMVEVKNHGMEREIIVQDCNGHFKSLWAEQILVAVGRTPNIEGLKLENAGVVSTCQGVSVDERLRTSQKHIYAGGDVIGRYLYTHAAGYEGGIIVSNAAFHLPRKADYSLLPWCTYCDPELAGIGCNEKRAQEAGIKYQVWSEAFASNDRSRAEGEENGQIKMLLNTKGKPIGVQIFGPQAGELISEWVAVMNGEVKLASLAGAMHPYPTLAEINKAVVGKYLQPKIFSETMQKALTFFFNFKGRACGE
jgi:pyruvate/2-oxoglutarate dehydrogenase complex dihydrolipoamide dehydrogenase (E3) component